MFIVQLITRLDLLVPNLKLEKVTMFQMAFIRKELALEAIINLG